MPNNLLASRLFAWLPKKMGDTATIAAARAKYSKQDGFLYLTDAPHRVIWVNASTKLPELLLAADDITS